MWWLLFGALAAAAIITIAVSCFIDQNKLCEIAGDKVGLHKAIKIVVKDAKRVKFKELESEQEYEVETSDYVSPELHECQIMYTTY